MKRKSFVLPSQISMGNVEYMESIYNRYLENPEQVEEAWRWFFQGMDFASSGGLRKSADIEKELGIFQLVYAYREHGALKARLDPLGIWKPDNFPRLEDFHLKPEDMDKKFTFIENLFGKNITLGQTISFLKKTYCGTLALQVGGCPPEVQTWFFNEFEKEQWNLDTKEKQEVFLQLAQTQYLENFLQFRFMGKKTIFSRRSGCPYSHDGTSFKNRRSYGDEGDGYWHGSQRPHQYAGSFYEAGFAFNLFTI